MRTTGHPPASVAARVLSRLVPGSRHAPWISVFALWVLAASVSPVAAAIGLDGPSSNTATSTSSITISHATGNGANRLMLVGVSLFDGAGNRQVNSVTYGGQNLTFIGGRRDSSNQVRCEIWSLTSPPSGTANVVVTLNNNSDGIVAGVVTFNGVDQITPLGSFNSAQGNSPIPSVTVSSESGQLVFDTVAYKDGQSLNVGANQTQQWSRADGSNKMRGAGSTEPGAASVTMSWSQPSGSGKEWAIGAVPIRPASFLPDGMIKISTEADSTYLTNNLYESTASVQVKSQEVVSGTTASYNLRFGNDGNGTDNLVITGTGNGSGFTVQYLDNTATDRTAAVTGAGYAISNVAAGASTVWILRVTPGGNPTPVPGGTSYPVFVTAVSANDNTKIDQVKAVTTSTSASLTLVKSADKGTTIPGEDITYTVNASNGSGLTAADNVVATEPIPANTGFKVGGATFDPGTSTLSFTVVYSNNNGSTWVYTPASGGCSAPTNYDFCVTHVRWTTTGSMPTGTAFTVGLIVRVK